MNQSKLHTHKRAYICTYVDLFARLYRYIPMIFLFIRWKRVFDTSACMQTYVHLCVCMFVYLYIYM